MMYCKDRAKWLVGLMGSLCFIFPSQAQEIRGTFPVGGGLISVTAVGGSVAAGGLDFLSPSGQLVPVPTVNGMRDASPFAFLIDNESTQVTFGNLGTPVTFDEGATVQLAVGAMAGANDITVTPAGPAGTTPVIASMNLFDESIFGDASSDATAPTLLNLAMGSNFVSGAVTQSNDLTAGDIDFFTFTIPEGQTLSGIFLSDYSPDDRGFHAINAGDNAIVPSGPNVGDTSQYLGSAHLDLVASDVNLLDDLGTPLAGSGFTGPLGPGTYSYVIQQTGPVVSSYTLDFAVVPEPATGSAWTVLVLSSFILVVRRRRAAA